MKKKYYIYHHLGLGDHIILNGLIRNIVDTKSIYFIFCKKQNIDSIEFMFNDLENVHILSVNSDADVLTFLKSKKDINLIKIGHENLEFFKRFYNCTWDESFYRQMNIDFKERWDSFYYVRDTETENDLFCKLNPDNEKFVLIHNIDSTGTDRINYKIISPSYKKIFVTKSKTIFDYGKLIEDAEEIHCIDSSFKHLVDSLDTNALLFYHKHYNLRSSSLDTHIHKKNWKLL